MSKKVRGRVIEEREGGGATWHSSNTFTGS